MNLRDIKEDERPVCPKCHTPMVWDQVPTYRVHVFGWQFNCSCIDTDRLKPDNDFSSVTQLNMSMFQSYLAGLKSPEYNV